MGNFTREKWLSLSGNPGLTEKVELEPSLQAIRFEQVDKLTPSFAVEFRQAVIDWIKWNPISAREACRWKLTDSVRAELNVASLEHTLPNTDLLLWTNEMYAASIRGYEAFEGTMLPSPVPIVRPQIWFWHGASSWDTEPAHTPMTKLFNLPNNCTHQSDFIGICDGRTDNMKPSGRRGIVLGHVFLNLDYRPGDGLPYYFRFLPPVFEGDRCPSTGYSRLLAQRQFLTLPFVGRKQETLPRPERRRMERNGQTQPSIQTVILRRQQDKNGAEGEGYSVEWSCSWLVSGHWRRLHAPRKEDGAGVTFVTPYVKGPADKPLKTHATTVFHVKR